MPRESFISPIDKGGKQELLANLAEFPELKDVRLSVIWPINEEKQKMLDILSRDALTPEDEQVLLSIVDSDDRVKLNILKYLLSGIDPQSFSNEFLETIEHRLKEKSGITMFDRIIQNINDTRSGLIDVTSQKATTPNSNIKNWLLGSRKAVFATPYTKEVAQRLVDVKRALEETQKNFPDVFGVIIVGSTMKGYARPESDLDFILLTNNDNAKDYFQQKLQLRNIEVCTMYSTTSGIYPSDTPRKRKFWEPKKETKERLQVLDEKTIQLFQGLFIGNREVLEAYQRGILKVIDPIQWKKYRYAIDNHESQEFKMKYYLGLSKQELNKIIAATLLTRVPPPYEEAKKVILGRKQKS